METVHRLQLPFKLDELTEGLGNCFPMAIIQQLRRPEILNQLRPATRRLVRYETGHTQLRQNVYEFIMKSKSPRVAALRLQYEETDGLINGENWKQYWTRMITDKTWVEYWFVQATAWYLQLDIWIIATSNTETSPYIEVNGNLADGEKPSGGPIITLGTKSNCHYQSLLPIEMFHLEFQHNEPESSSSLQQKFDEMKENEDKPKREEEKKTIRQAHHKDPKRSGERKCEDGCKTNEEKNKDNIGDIRQAIAVDMVDDKINEPMNMKKTKSDNIREIERNRKAAYRKRKKEEDHDKLKEKQRIQKAMIRIKKRAEDNSGHYVVASSRPPERRPLERRTLAPIRSGSIILRRWVSNLILVQWNKNDFFLN